jgi:copper(I)-binding protein
VIRSGWRSTLPRRLVLGTAAVLIPLLAGCEAGNNAPTLQFHYPTDAAGTVVGKLSIRNVFVLGAPLGSSLRKGQSASLFLAMVNTGAPDRLLSVSAPGSAASVTLPAGGVPVINLHPVFLLSGPKPQAVLVNLTRPLTSGSTIRLQLTFQKAGLVTIMAPVLPRAAHYATFAPPQSTATTPTATVTPGAHASPSPSKT